MECYKQFAHIYDELINGDVNYKKWSKTIINICNEYGVKKENYLDLACGTGNLTQEIMEDFKHIWAVDFSYDMLMEAEKKIRRLGHKPKLICQDICKLNLNQTFDLITCCLDSTNYILDEGDLEEYFKGVYNSLNDNGIFVFDINSYYKLSKILGNNMFHYDNDDVVYIWENQFEDDIVDMFLTFFKKNSAGCYERFDEEHSERAYTEEKIDSILKKLNFKILKKLDTYKSEIITKETERIAYIVCKNQ